ncbi:MAG TPA: mechanosensitive ion channel protein MscS, partial [Psychrobacter sp.]|nr:mechanosensitive ion channel protein MscS [Psychrobacter sp.]
MASYFDRPMIRRFIKAWGQMVLLLSIVCTWPTYAAGEELSGIATVLGVESTQEATPDSDPAPDEEASEPATSLPTPAQPPVISGESTNNGQIETTPTPQKDNEIHQRINGIFSEIEGLQAVNVSVSQGVVTLTGETANEKKAQQAINLTNRLTDVVTVDDNINRTLDVQENVSTVYQGL